MRACLEKHGEAARAAAAASVGPVPPYVSHFSLHPASASTRWNVRGTSRLEHASGKNSSALLPPRAHSLPADHGQAPSSDHIYSQGLTAREASLAGIKDAAYQVSVGVECIIAPFEAPRLFLFSHTLTFLPSPSHLPPSSPPLHFFRVHSSSRMQWPWAQVRVHPWPPVAAKPCTMPW